MAQKKKRKKGRSQMTMWVVSALIGVGILAALSFAVKKMITTDETRRIRQIQMIKVVEPPTPQPKPMEEKPPETQIKEEPTQQFVQEDTQQSNSNEQAADDTPAGDQLGLDADGSAGSDGFGLAAKKGGKALIGGTHGPVSLMKKYSWYIQIIQNEIKANVKEILDKQGVVPKGNLKTMVTIALDDEGRITAFDVVGSSGNATVDEAVKKALGRIKVSEAPPEGMPRSLKIRVTSTG